MFFTANLLIGFVEWFDQFFVLSISNVFNTNTQLPYRYKNNIYIYISIFIHVTRLSDEGDGTAESHCNSLTRASLCASLWVRSLGVFGTNDICVLGECTALNIGCNKAAHIYRKTPLPSVRSV